ncbi:MAG: hypothetical protein E6J66_19220 [Deltaproteobacteria bacterium]|nr:MAG: hypothetical protein E6J66_19220 [Deltaproteobacteria bacterium]
MRQGCAVGLALACGCASAASTKQSFARPTLAEQIGFREVEIVPASFHPARGVAILSNADAETVQREFADAIADAGQRLTGLRFSVSTRLRVSSAEGDISLPAAEPPGHATFLVWVKAITLIGSEADAAPVVLQAGFGMRRARFGPAISAVETDLEARATTPESRVTLLLLDPVPRAMDAWLAEDSQALRAAASRLRDRAAEGLVTELFLTAGPGRAPFGRCILGAVSPSDGSENVARNLARIEWEAWRPEDDTPAPFAVLYDLRLWNIGAGRAPQLVLERGALAEPRAILPAALDAGSSYGWTVRASLASADGRRWSTPWSYPAQWNAWCEREPHPSRTFRFKTAGETDPVASPPIDPKIRGAAAFHLPPLAERSAVRTVRVVAPQTSPLIAFETGDPRVGAHAAGGVVLGGVTGAAYGVAESVKCGIFGPICLLILAPALAVTGAVAGGVSGGVRASGETPSEDARDQLKVALRDAAQDADIRRLFADEVVRAGSATAARFETAAIALDAMPHGSDEAMLEVVIARAVLIGGNGRNPHVSLELDLTGRLTLAGRAAGERTVSVRGPGPLPLSTWLVDGAALVHGAVAAQLPRASAELVATILGGPEDPPSAKESGDKQPEKAEPPDHSWVGY